MRITLLFLLLASYSALAGEGVYSVSKIPVELLKSADAVKRIDDTRFEIISTGQTRFYQKFAITILNEEGDKFSRFSEYYDQFRKVESIEGNLYDASGALVRKLKPKEIQDLGGLSDGSMIDDNRIKTHNFYCKSYPYTIEYEVEIKVNHTFHLPTWVPQEARYLSVEKSSFTVVVPDDYVVRFKAFNYKGEPTVTAEKGKKISVWQVSNMKPVIREAYSPGWEDLTTIVKLAPSFFQLKDYKGDMSSWKEFGKFIYTLNSARDVLPPAMKTKVQQLVAHAPSDGEKVKILYKYLQQNTRYIGVQLGIGGWQPFEANYVAEKAYGDCKALSNYMYSLLKEAGIRSCYALINAGDNPAKVFDDFPSAHFNHAILCVPLKKDTIWLECTDQYKAPGYMGDFTGNRKALLITEEGGVLVNTPAYNLNENQQIRSINGKLDENGNLNVWVHTNYMARQQDDLQEIIHVLSKEKVKEYLHHALNLSTYDITHFKYNQQNDRNPTVTEDLELFINQYATVTGKRLFIVPNILNRGGTLLDVEKERRYDLSVEYAYRDVDTVLIQIPEGYEVEAMPAPVSLKTKYGNYSSTTKLDGNKLQYIRVLEQFSVRAPASEYAAYAKFVADIYKSDRSRVVLVKKS
jgi:hypothetical protein